MEKEKKEETGYLFHKRALLMNEYFRNQRSFFTSLRSKIPYLQKRIQNKSLQKVFDVRGVEKSEEKS